MFLPSKIRKIPQACFQNMDKNKSIGLLLKNKYTVSPTIWCSRKDARQHSFEKQFEATRLIRFMSIISTLNVLYSQINTF